MILKASLHIHTKEDKKDGHMIKYDVFDLVDEAAKRGFRVLGFTPHQKYVFKEEYAEYAKKKGILLIPGVERSLGRVSAKHVIILNCGPEAEKIKNFRQLEEYKKNHPEVFVLSPHPTFSRLISIGERNLRRYISLFDAIEHSWLYSIKINKNQKAAYVAREFKKPFIATADVHRLKKLDTDYIILSANDFSTEGVFEAIRNGCFENITFPKRQLDLVLYIAGHIVEYYSKILVKKPLVAMVFFLAGWLLLKQWG